MLDQHIGASGNAFSDSLELPLSSPLPVVAPQSMLRDFRALAKAGLPPPSTSDFELAQHMSKRLSQSWWLPQAKVDALAQLSVEFSAAEQEYSRLCNTKEMAKIEKALDRGEILTKEMRAILDHRIAQGHYVHSLKSELIVGMPDPFYRATYREGSDGRDSARFILVVSPHLVSFLPASLIATGHAKGPFRVSPFHPGSLISGRTLNHE